MIPDEEVWPDAGTADGDFTLDRGGRLKKAATAFRTISEVADDLHVPQHVLRFWETRFPQVKPLKRGGGRRYYRPDDVVLLRRISDLLYIQGYTIKGVQRLLLEGDGVLAGDLPPPDLADLDEGAVPSPGMPAPEAVDAAGYGGGRDENVPADASSRRAVQDIQALREALREILAGLEAMRRQMPA